VNRAVCVCALSLDVFVAGALTSARQMPPPAPFSPASWTTAAAANTNRPGPSVERQSVAGARPDALADGKRLYDVNCANCHGARAQGAVKAGIGNSIIAERGGKQPPDLTDPASDHGSTDTEVFTVIKKGIPSGMMAPYEGRLSDVEIRNVVAYVRSLSSPQAATTAAAPAAAPAPQSTEGTLEVADYAELPLTGDKSTNLISGQLARGSILRDEPGGRRFFVTDLNGPLYILTKQTKQLTPYLNFDGMGDRAGLFPKFTAARGFAAGLMNFVFDPDYARNGIFYTLHMEDPNTPGESAMPKTGVVPGLNLAGYTTTTALSTPIVPDARFAREMVIVEWTDRQIGNTTFEGTAREVLRMQLPGLFHPLNEITFNPAARPGDPEWRVMYLGVGDSGTGERPGPMRMHAQRLDTLHGKILRIIPMLSEHASTSTPSESGRYRIPNNNPFVSIEGARKEIWALGLRNPHRLTWYVDAARPRESVLLAFNIGLVSWETVMIIKKGANYGYPLREGTQSMSATNGMGLLPEDDMIPVQLSDTVTRGTVKPTYPVAAYPHTPAAGGDAIANGFAYRGKRIPALQGTLVFGDITTGRIWYAQMKEVLAADDGNPLTLAPLHELGTRLRALSEETFRRRGGQGDSLPGFGAVAGRGRVDIRLAEDNDGELYVLTKGDGMIREVRSVR
jgi:mono/diheme cytochrome c family protein